MNKRFNWYVGRLLKVIMIAILALLFLLLIGTLVFHIPGVQNYVAERVVDKVEEKAGVDISIDQVAISLHGMANFKRIFASDNKNDTLLFAENIKVNVNLLKLLNKKIQINNIYLNQALVRIVLQDEDSTMNFSPYLHAFQKPPNSRVRDKKQASPFLIILKKIQLNDVRFLYESKIDQNRFSINSGELKVKLNNTDFNKKLIDVKTVSLVGSKIDLLINSKKPKTEPKPFPLTFKLQKDISLQDVRFSLKDNFSAQKLDFDNINITVTSQNLNIKEKLVYLDEIELSDSKFSIEKYAMSAEDSTRVAEFNKAKNKNTFEWDVEAHQLTLENNSFSFSKEDHLNLKSKVNYSDLQFDQISGALKDIELHRYFLSVAVRDFSVIEKSGYRLDHFSTDFNFSNTQTSISNLELETPHTRVAQTSLLKYDSVDELRKDINHLNFEIKLDTALIGIADVNYLLPLNIDSVPYISKLKHNIRLATNITSYNDTLSIDNLNTSYDGTSLQLKGYITNYTHISDSTFADIEIKDFKTTRKDITNFLPDSMLPDKMSLPSNIKLNASFRGTKNIFKTQNQVITDFGEILVKAETNNDDSSKGRIFQSDLGLRDFDLGKLFSNDTIGKITQYTTVSGTLPTKKYSDATADLKTNIKSFTYLNYIYTDIELDGILTGEKIKADIAYADSNLIFSFSGISNRNDSVPDYELVMNLEGADLLALHLVNTDLKAKGKMKAKISGNNLNNSNGELVLSNIVLLKDNELYEIDSIKTVLTNKKNESSVKLESSFITADYSGTIKPGNIYPSLKKHFSQYLPGVNDTLLNNYDTGQFEFSMRLFNSEIITRALLPNLKSILPSSVDTKYNADNNQFNLDLDFPHIEYNNIVIKDLNLRVVTNDSTNLSYNMSFGELGAGAAILGKTELFGKAIADSLKFMLRVPGDTPDPKFLLGAYLTQSNNYPKLGFVSDKVTLNYNKFQLPEDNHMLLTPERAKFHNMRLYTQDQELQITNDSSKRQEYIIKLNNFKISNITELVETETEIIDGILQGTITLENRENNKLFNADLAISDMFVNNYKVFDKVTLTANNVQKNRIEINSKFLGAEDELEMGGYMSRINDENHLDFNVNIKELNLNYFKEFTTGILDDIEGSIHGNLQIQGKSDSPQLNGQLNFKEISVKPDYINTTLKVNNEKLTISNNRVNFSNFNLSDFENNKMQVDGFVDFRNFNNPQFNLSVNSKNFRFLNTEYQDGRLYYGKVRANLDAEITGNPEQPNINLTLFMGDKSEFHFVIPELTSASVEEEGVVRFVNKKDTLWSGILKRESDIQDSLQTLKGTGISLLANIEIDSNMDIYIELDPATNEELFLNGNATLSFQQRRAETPSLSGRFEIQEGTYTLTLYEVIRRTFSIEPGSYLMWNGDVQNPVTDITAMYRVRTSPVPLISNETADFNTENTSQYSNNTPFLINLNIDGELLKPELGFQLSTQPGQSDALIQAKLAQLNQNESQLHKQVFSLLLFNSFIESTSASNRSTAYELNATARTSVSKLLTRQISSFADRYIKYVDLDVGVNSYYNRVGDEASGQTEVSLDVSKRLFNDKLKVQIGGDFNVENSNATTNEQKQKNSNIAGDFVIEYKLDEDGTYRIQGFNKTEYEDFFDGEVNKTGASFIFNKDFYQLNQLFKSDTTKNKKREKDK